MAVLIVGLGGTGCQAAGHIYDMIGHQAGLKGRNMEILAIDSKSTIDPSPNGSKQLAIDGNFVSLGQGLNGVATYRVAKNKKSLQNWWPTKSSGLPEFNPLDSFSHGAGKVRLNGRYTYWKNCDRIIQQLNTTYNRLGLLKHLPDLIVCICCASTNGTGSSMFVDMAYLIRYTWSLQGLTAMPRIYGFVLDPGIVEGFGSTRGTTPEISYANGLNFYRELDFWMNYGRIKPYVYTTDSGRKIIPPQMPPIDFCFVITATNQMNTNLGSWNPYIELTANSMMKLSMDTGQAGADGIPAKFLDTFVVGGGDLFPNDPIFRRVCQYGSIGYSVIEFPDEMVLDYCGHRYVSDILDLMNHRQGISVSDIEEHCEKFVDAHKIREEPPRDDLFELIKPHTNIPKQLKKYENLKIEKKTDVQRETNKYDLRLEDYRGKSLKVLDTKYSEIEEAITEKLRDYVDDGQIDSARKWCELCRTIIKKQRESVENEFPETSQSSKLNALNSSVASLFQKEKSFFSFFGKEERINKVKIEFRNYYLRQVNDISAQRIIIFFIKIENYLQFWEKTIKNFKQHITDKIEEEIDSQWPVLLAEEIDLGHQSEHKEGYSVSVHVGAWRDFCNKTFYNLGTDPSTLSSAIMDVTKKSQTGLTARLLQFSRLAKENSSWAADNQGELEKWRNIIKEDLLKKGREQFSVAIGSVTMDYILDKEADFILRPYLNLQKKMDTVSIKEEENKLLQIYGGEFVEYLPKISSSYTQLMDSAKKARLDSLEARTSPFWSLSPKQSEFNPRKNCFWSCSLAYNPKVAEILSASIQNPIIDSGDRQKVAVFRTEAHSPLNELRSVQKLKAYSENRYWKNTPCLSDIRHLNEWNDEFWTPDNYIQLSEYFYFAIGEASGYIKFTGKRTRSNFKFGNSTTNYKSLDNALDAIHNDEILQKNLIIACTKYLAGIDGRNVGSIRKQLSGKMNEYANLHKKYSSERSGDIYHHLYELVTRFMKKYDLKPYKSTKKTKSKTKSK